jgi:hypothetical protein
MNDEAKKLLRELIDVDLSLCDECGGDETKCDAECVYRRGRELLSRPEPAAQAAVAWSHIREASLAVTPIAPEVQAMDPNEILRCAARLHWLHNNTYVDAEGYEYGVAKVKFENGQPVSVLWTYADHRDVDAAIAAYLERNRVVAALAKGRPFESLDAARAFVRTQMPDESEQVIDNVAWSLWRPA